MKVTVVKGRFTPTVSGSTVRIRCNICDKAARQAASSTGASSSSSSSSPPDEAPPTMHPGPLHGVESLRQASALMTRQKGFARAKGALDTELSKPMPNTMAPVVVAPVTMNGRPVGCQAVVCAYCGQAGLINVEAERPGTGAFGFQPRSLNENPQAHVRRRAVITFIPLLALDYLVRNRHVRPGATVVCAGASLQCQGKSSTGSDGAPRQDAHQILRELSIDGTPLYTLVRACPGLSQKIQDVVTYCHGVISHLDAAFNEVDGLVERAITVLMIDLGHLVLNGSLRSIAGPTDAIFGRMLWGYVMARYKYAVTIALIEADPGPKRDVLLFYKGIVDQMVEEGPPDIALNGLGDLCDYFGEELRPI